VEGTSCLLEDGLPGKGRPGKVIKLGAMWKELPVSKKAVYQEKADQVRLSSWEPCGRNFLSPGRWSTRAEQTG